MKNSERRYPGQIGSPGVAYGSLVRSVHPPEPAPRTGPGGPATERQRLLDAIRSAIAELDQLARREGPAVAQVLAFQIEMLGDIALSAPAIEAIEHGDDAPTAWRACVAHVIDAYLDAEDDTFRARAADCIDMRDRVVRRLDGVGEPRAWLPDGAIVLDTDMTPTRFLAQAAVRPGGIALLAGSPASHTAVLARARGIPLLCGIGREPAAGTIAILDAEKGELVLNPTPATAAHYTGRIRNRRAATTSAQAAMAHAATTVDGIPIEVRVNVDDPDSISDRILGAADGIGLVRTEALCLDDHCPPDEQTQYARYAALLKRAGKRCCIFRTLDIGGDKPLPQLQEIGERNPFLGMRGIRLCLDHPELFRPQVRALLRIAAHQNVRVMLPMVTVPEEYDEARALFSDCLKELLSAGVTAAMPPLGMMVETPAAAVAIDTFDADFYSIGSNDLTQYTMAAARDGGGRLAALNRHGQPAVLRLIANVVRHADAARREVSLCGDSGADPVVLEHLLQTGLRVLSVAPAALGQVKQTIRRLRISNIDDAG